MTKHKEILARPGRPWRTAAHLVGLAVLGAVAIFIAKGPPESWVAGQYMKVIYQYLATLEEHPNPPAANLTRF